MLRPVREQFARWFSVLSKKSLPPKSRALMSLFFVVVLIGGLFIFGSVAHAQATEFFNGMIQFAVSLMLTIAKVFIQLTIWALKMFILICGYNNYINADVVQLGWNMVRDVANLFFIVILLVIAFGTILGLESYEWRKALGKLIFAALFVNFSNLICQLFIDVAQVFTMTFLNAIAGTAGGNIIKIFNFDTIYNITTQGVDPQSLQLELLGAGMMIVFFTLLALFTIGAYMVVAVARMVVLWVLMILSPLAFVLSALPQGKSYADEFWARFTNHVLAAPVMVFFLWLAFATLGNGNIVQENIEPDHPLGQEAYVTSKTDINNNPLGASFSEAASWENMANFAVAIAFLMVGIGAVQKLGVVGGHLTASALNFAKNVATIATGISAARWLSRGVFDKTKKGIGLAAGGLYKATLGHTAEIASNFAKRQVAGFKNWVALEVKPKVKPVWEAAKGEEKDFMRGGDGNFYDLEGKRVMKDPDDDKKWIRAESRDGGKTVKPKQARDADGKLSWDYVRDKKTKQPIVEEYEGGAIHGFLRSRHRELIKSRKNLEKVENELKTREGLMDKRVTAIPRYGMQAFEGGIPDAMDRWEQGQLEAETERSAAKTRQHKAEGKYAVFANARFKDGSWQADKPTVIEQVGANLERAAAAEAQIGAVTAEAKNKFREGKVKHGGGTNAQQVMEAKISGELRAKAAEGEAGNLEQRVRTAAVNASVGEGEKGAIARAIAAEKQAHTESTRQEVATKGVERAYIKGDHGTAELAEEALLHATMGRDDAVIKAAEAEANRVFAESEPGTRLIKETNSFEQAAQAADQFIKNTKNAELQKSFNEAFKNMRNIIDTVLKQGGKDMGKKIKAELDKSAEQNAFVRALKAQSEGGRTDLSLQIAQTRAQEAGKAGYVEIPAYGAETPSAVLIPIGERLTKDLYTLEAPAAAAMVSKWLTHIMEERKQTKDGKISDDQKAVLFSAMAHLQRQAQNDDFMGEVVRLLDGADAGVLREPQQIEQAKVIKELLVEKTGIIKKGADGYEAIFDNAAAANLQSLVVMGGDEEMVSAHNIVAKQVDELNSQTKNLKKGEKKKVVIGVDSNGVNVEFEVEGGKDADYYDVARTVINGGITKKVAPSLTYGEFEKKYDEAQETLQEATSSFTRDSLSAGHLQNVGYQQLDQNHGKYRLATPQEAITRQAGEARKRKGQEGWQVHGMGAVNLKQMKMQKITIHGARAQMGHVTTQLIAKNILPRTRQMWVGGGAGKDPVVHDGHAVLGGGREEIKKTYASNKEYLKSVVIPSILGAADGYKMAIREFHPASATGPEAENGLIKIEIEKDDSGVEIKTDTYSKFIKEVIKQFTNDELKDISKELGADALQRLKDLQLASAAKEQNFTNANKGGKGKKGTGAPDEQADDES